IACCRVARAIAQTESQAGQHGVSHIDTPSFFQKEKSMARTIMPKNAFFDKRIVPLADAKVSIMTHAFNYGTGVFEGIRAYWNETQGQLYVFQLRPHFERFLNSCRTLLIDIPYSVDELCSITLELLRCEGNQTDTYIRPLAYKSSQGIGVRLHDLESD